jgi:RnfABCDGE-type electron transport complex G subunit
MNNAIRYPLVLVLISAVAAAGVGSVYVLTKKRIDQQREKEEEEALEKVFGPGAKRDVINESAASDDRVYRVQSAEGQLLGYVANGSARGYSSVLKVVVGLDPEWEKVVGINVVSQQETPGLGSRIEERRTGKTWWKVLTGQKGTREEKQAWFQAQFAQKPIEDVRLRRKPEEKGVDAVTGASVTSRAVVSAVSDAIKKVHKALGRSGEAGSSGHASAKE